MTRPPSASPRAATGLPASTSSAADVAAATPAPAEDLREDLPEDLFGGLLPVPSDSPRPGTAASGRGREVTAPSADPALVALGVSLPPGLRLGTSTWSYPGWAGLVYEGDHSESVLSRKGLHAYAAHPLLRAAGIDRGFYGPIPLADYLAYAAQVPDGFRFLVKGPASVCDPWLRAGNGAGRLRNAAFLDAAIAARDFVEPATAGLGGRCGPLLFQLSPLGAMADEPAAFLGQLDAFLSALPPLDRQLTPHACYALELRDPALLTPRFIKLLRQHGARYCISAREGMPPVARQAAALALLDEETAGPLVLRWMLREGYRYDQAEAAFMPFDKLVAADPVTRHAIADIVARTLRAGQTACVIVSNNAEGCAPLSCALLAQAIAERMD